MNTGTKKERGSTVALEKCEAFKSSPRVDAPKGAQLPTS